ncbi:MAG TPA: hypothetical protein VEU97_11230, partial [Ktedonobacteraceae bacterium]|nr:hypothetical protein [Ktedonobacteraceae bacterium]
MPHIHKHHLWSALSFCSLLLLCLVVAACGGAGTPTAGSTNSAGSAPQTIAHSSDQQSQQKSVSNTVGQQYLIKSLNITMEVKDTQRVATDLQAWLSTTDPLSTADSINYQQVGDNLYD